MKSLRFTLFAILIAISILSTLSCSSKKDETVYLSVVVNYDLSLNKAVDSGDYNWSDKNITANNFPALAGEEGQKYLEFALEHFNRPINFEDAITEMDIKGFRPATAREILALGIQYPNLQKQFPIVALGQICVDPADNYRTIIFLDAKDVIGRELNLARRNKFISDCRFLFVKK